LWGLGLAPVSTMVGFRVESAGAWAEALGFSVSVSGFRKCKFR
jgi:hypothetical protein